MNNRKETERYNVKEASFRLGIEPFTLRRMVKAREIAFYRPRSRGPIYFFEAHLTDFESQHTFEPMEVETKKAA